MALACGDLRIGRLGRATAWRPDGTDARNDSHHVAKVRVAGSNPVVRSKVSKH